MILGYADLGEGGFGETQIIRMVMMDYDFGEMLCLFWSFFD